MNALHVKYVLIGGGLASDAAAEAIRSRDPDGTLLMVGQEVHRPYHRPMLSTDYLLGRKGRADLFTHDDEHYARLHVTLRTGRRATSLDLARRQVGLDSGEAISFDRLLLATGASPRHLRVPGADLPNLFYLRTAEDADRIHNAVEKARAEGRPNDVGGRGRVAIVGGGLLAVELSSTFRQLGLGVDLIMPNAHPWPRFAGETLGRFAIRFLESKGVRVHAQTAPDRLEGDGRVQRVVLPGGITLECDLVLPALGVTPNKDLIRGTSLAAEKAILVDEHCRTSDERVYAAGDCAAVFDARFGKYRHIDHWDAALETGRIAGLNMAASTMTTGALGSAAAAAAAAAAAGSAATAPAPAAVTGVADEVRYEAVNHFTTTPFDLRVDVWGESRHVHRRVVRGAANLEAPSFVEVGLSADGRVNQVVAVNHPAEQDVMEELVRRRLVIDGREAMLRDPGVPMAELLE